MIDGAGDPNSSPEFAAAIEALYGVSYAVKFNLRNGASPVDYAVMPLESLWWSNDMAAFERGDKSAWKWTLMIVQPPELTSAGMATIVDRVRIKKPNLAALDQLRLERWVEGPSAQLLHVGPYDGERPNIERLHAYVTSIGGRMRGKHHEIYLNDATRTVPERLKTIIRQPFTPRKGAD
jgi:hypothetical protein